MSSSVGKKIAMAVTGLLLLGFVVAHLLGNLQLFLGQEAFNAYAHFLKTTPELLWPARIGLLAVFIIHVVYGVKLRAENRAARPVDYAYQATVQAPVASLYMLETGLVILVFVLLHLAHYTLGLLQPEFYHLVDAKGRHDVFAMAVHGFQTPTYSIFYILCMLGLGAHLSHAIGSAVQTLGGAHPRTREMAFKAGRVIGWGIALGYITIPVSVLLGIISLPA